MLCFRTQHQYAFFFYVLWVAGQSTHRSLIGIRHEIGWRKSHDKRKHWLIPSQCTVFSVFSVMSYLRYNPKKWVATTSDAGLLIFIPPYLPYHILLHSIRLLFFSFTLFYSSCSYFISSFFLPFFPTYASSFSLSTLPFPLLLFSSSSLSSSSSLPPETEYAYDSADEKSNTYIQS